MEALDLPRRYRTIFLAGPTFNLLPDDDAALLALRGIRAHLNDDGVGVVPLFIPSPTPSDELGRVREAEAPDGAVLRFRVLSEERNESARTQRAVLRYERHMREESEVVDRPWILHWYTRQRFGDLAAAAGLYGEASEVPDTSGTSDDFTFLLRRA